ncbi:glycosyltransferase family 1 protein [Paenibacillus sp. IITD108]|uniref:glycosyltransferase family 1 protein n=1 Tax=Paenibacillus sp. IITD108 TaxID=3116649 RepID=UPI002F419AC7
MKTIRVLNVVTKMDAAGIETLLMNIYRNIDRKKVQFDFLTHRHDKGFYDDEILELGGKIYNVPAINPLKHGYYLNSLDNFFKNHRDYKIVHSHINTFSMYPLRAAMNAGIPVRIAHSHIANVPYDLKTPFRIYTKSKLTKYSTHNFACSEIAGRWLFGRNKDFKVFNNSIDTFKFIFNDKKSKEIKQKLGISGKFVVGHVGRFDSQKNHMFLLEIFKEVHRKNNNAILLLVGDGILRNKIEDKVRELNLTENVILTGVRSDLPDIYQAMDVFLFPSLYEGLGIVLIEAQAAGLPCVVANTIPKEAFITDLLSELSLDSNPEEWANEVLRQTNKVRINTYTRIKESGFDLGDEVRRLEEFYNTVHGNSDLT